uniref:Uncharacterized protein n=1 Tax=Sinocyclocheilus grahami TaxID=75366 RepID=A0A672SMC7_SINGR
DAMLRAAETEASQRHSVYLESVSLAPLERLHLILRDHLKGLKLNRRKARLFEHNRKHKEDVPETCSWDEGPSDEEF